METPQRPTLPPTFRRLDAAVDRVTRSPLEDPDAVTNMVLYLLESRNRWWAAAIALACLCGALGIALALQ